MVLYVLFDDRLINCTPSDFTNIETEHRCSAGILYKINSGNIDELTFILALILFIT